MPLWQADVQLIAEICVWPISKSIIMLLPPKSPKKPSPAAKPPQSTRLRTLSLQGPNENIPLPFTGLEICEAQAA